MLRIGICEDEKIAAEQLHNIIVKILFSCTDVEFQDFTDGEEVIEAIRREEFFVDLLFLDIHMEHLDGLETAKYIRKHGIDVDIIFWTVSKKHVFEGYTYKAFAYHLKPIDENVLAKDLLRYLEEKKQVECLNIKTKGGEIHIPLNKVLYFKSEKRRIIAYMYAGETAFYSKMDEVEKMVGNKGFIRCHQSYMVNYNMIDAIGRTEVTVRGIPIPVSRRYYKGTEQILNDNVTMQIAHSLAMNQAKAGAIVFVKGKLLGAMIRIRSNQKIKLGRDGTKSDIVVNDRAISRLHCSIMYNGETGEYFVCDYSLNGLYRENGKKLPKGKVVKLKMGDELCLGNDKNIIRLG